VNQNHKRFLARIGTNVLLAAIVGSVVAIIEILVRMLSSRATSVHITRTYFFPVAVCYAVIWVVGILAFTGIAESFFRFFKSDVSQDRRTAFYLAALVAGSTFVMIGGYVNMVYLPRFWTLSSVIFDAVWLLICCGLFMLVRFTLVAKGYKIIGHVARIPILSATLLVILAGCCVVSNVPRSMSAAAHVESSRDATPTVSSPNVLIILIDTLRADHLSCYGYERNTSPNIDDFAAESILFENAIAQSSWTLLSTASLLTSLYPSTHGATAIEYSMGDGIVTLAEVLQSEGYATAMFSDNPWVSPEYGLAQGMDSFYDAARATPLIGHICQRLAASVEILESLIRPLDAWTLSAHVFTSPGVMTSDADLLNRAFFAWIDEDSQPFFAYIHYIDPHAPYSPPAPYDTIFGENHDGETVSTPPMVYPADCWPVPKASALPKEKSRNMMARYDGEIASIDRSVGEVLSALESRGLYDRTLIVITSDHGEEFYEHFAYGHGHTLYNELLHVPLMMRIPESLTHEKRISNLVSLLDVAPTILSVCGIEVPPQMQGRNLGDAISDYADQPEQAAGDIAYSELPFVQGNTQCSGGRSLQRDGYKLIVADCDSGEWAFLYDLESDPGEQLDISEHDIDVLADMESRFRMLAKRNEVNSPNSERVTLDSKTAERLRDLGYLK